MLSVPDTIPSTLYTLIPFNLEKSPMKHTLFYPSFTGEKKRLGNRRNYDYMGMYKFVWF